MSHKWEETGHFRHLDMRGRYMSAMATEDSPKHQKVATWAPLERHGDRRSQKQSGGSPLGVAMATSLASGDLVHSRHGRHLGSPWRP
jgi:hypothetical protein